MLELRTLIQQEIDGNPTLEVEDNEMKIENPNQEKEEFREEFERLSKLDDEWRDYMSQNASYAKRSTEEDERRQFFFDSLTEEQTLQQHSVRYAANSDAAKKLIAFGDSKPATTVKPEELAAWTLVANLLMNLDEAVTK